MDLFDRLKEGLSKTRRTIADSLDSVFGDYSQVDDDFFDSVEESLILADMGVETAGKIVSEMRERVAKDHIKDPQDLRNVMIEAVSERIKPSENAYDFENRKSVILLVGVNGAGKTTTAGKLAARYSGAGKKVIICGADTFRAAASDQLRVWADRASVGFIGAPEGTDPAAVIYDGVAAFRSRNADMLICDTAGRLHNKKNLMEELARIYRIIERELPEAEKETMLVLDATTGQNALSQAREFSKAAMPDGLVLTKMDGSSKGGIAVAVSDSISVPVKFIGVGERIEDLQKFNAEAFLKAIFG